MAPQLRSRVVIAGSVVVFLAAAIYIFWPSAPPTPGPASPRPPVSASAPDARPDVADELAALSDNVAAASRLSTSPGREKQLKSLDARLGELEPSFDKTSLPAVEVLELRQQIALARGKPAEARKALRAWLADRGIRGRKHRIHKDLAWGEQGAEVLNRVYQHHLGRLRAEVDGMRKQPFSDAKMAQLERAEHAIRDLGRTMATDSKAGQIYETLLQKAMLAQAKYADLADEFGRWMDETRAAEGDDRSAIKAVWRAEWLYKRKLYEESERLFVLVASRYPRTERGSYAALMAADVQLKLNRPRAARAGLEANIAARDEGRWAAESYLRLAELLQTQGQSAEAVATYRLLSVRHPGTHFAPLALLRAAAETYFEKEYAESIEIVHDLRTRFPNAKAVGRANKVLAAIDRQGYPVEDILGRLRREGAPVAVEQPIPAKDGTDPPARTMGPDNAADPKQAADDGAGPDRAAADPQTAQSDTVALAADQQEVK